MGFGSFVKKAAGGLTLGIGKKTLGMAAGALGIESEAYQPISVGGPDPAIFKHEDVEKAGEAAAGDVTVQPFDYTKIGNILKQYRSTTGRAKDPTALKGAVQGQIESRIMPMAALAESAAGRKERAITSAKSRNLQRDMMSMQKYGIDLDVAFKNQTAKAEFEAAQTAGAAGIGSMIGGVAGFIVGGPVGAMVGSQVGAGAGPLVF